MEYREMSAEELARIGEVDREERIEGVFVTTRDGSGFGLKTELVERDPPVHIPSWSPEGVARRMASWKPSLDRGGLLFGAFEEDRLAGFVLLGPGRRDGSAEIVALFVDKRVRRKGVGAELMAWAEGTAAERGVTSLFAHTNPTASAAGFYMKMDFAIVGLTSKEIVEGLSGDITVAKRIGKA